MLSDCRARWIPRSLAAALIAVATETAAQNPAASAAKQAQQQMIRQMEMRQMMSQSYGVSGPDALPTLRAFVRIYAPTGPAEGMGLFNAEYGGGPDKPRRSWIDLAGKRWFPKDTDSIRVWDLPGLPLDGNWAFTVAKGVVTAFTFHPLRDPDYFTLTPTDSILRAGPPAWILIDTLWYKHESPKTAELEKANGDPVMAIRLINTDRHRKGGKQYLDLLERADHACKAERYGQADSLFALAREWDAGYPRLHLHLGRCKEKRADTAAALEAYRYALRYAGTDPAFRKEAERRMVALLPTPAGEPPTPRKASENPYPYR